LIRVFVPTTSGSSQTLSAQGVYAERNQNPLGINPHGLLSMFILIRRVTMYHKNPCIKLALAQLANAFKTAVHAILMIVDATGALVAPPHPRPQAVRKSVRSSSL
jgi:hypothetical protein